MQPLVPVPQLPFPPALFVCIATASSQRRVVLRILAQQAGMHVVDMEREPHQWTDAFASAFSPPPTAVLTDLDTPGSDAFLHWLHHRPRLRHTTLVGVSTSASVWQRWTLRMMGAQLLLLPCTREAFRAVLCPASRLTV